MDGAFPGERLDRNIFLETVRNKACAMRAAAEEPEGEKPWRQAAKRHSAVSGAGKRCGGPVRKIRDGAGQARNESGGEKMLNQVVLMGRLTDEPELRHTQSGVAVVRFTLAVERSYVRQGEERQTDFIDVVVWRNTAEFVSKYFRKGQLAAVQGSIQTGTYTDKQGIKRKKFEVVADRVHFAERKKDGDGRKGQADNGGWDELDDGDLPF